MLDVNSALPEPLGSVESCQPQKLAANPGIANLRYTGLLIVPLAEGTLASSSRPVKASENQASENQASENQASENPVAARFVRPARCPVTTARTRNGRRDRCRYQCQ